MKNKRNLIILWILALIPVLAVAVLYGRLPAEVPVHWSLDGTVSYGPKSTLWITALIPVAGAAFLPLLPKIDPRRQNYQKFQGYYDGFCIVFTLFMLLLNLVVLSESLHPGRISVAVVISAAVGILFMFIGNLLPKVKSNFFMGIKTPWALSDTDVWNKTHRLGGALFFISGLVMVVTSFWLGDVARFSLLMALVLVAAFLPTVMSYVWYRQIHKNDP